MNKKISSNNLSLNLLFTEFADKSFEGIYITDTHGLILYVNDRFCDIIQQKKNELLNQPFYKIFQNSDQKQIKENYLKNLKNNQIHTHYEKYYVLRNGRSIWIDFRSSILDINEKEKIVINIIRNISDHKFNEIELITSEERFRNFFKETSDAIFVNHLTEDLLFDNYIEVNKQACELLRYSYEEILNLSIYDIIPIRDCQGIEQIVAQIKKNKHIVFEIDLKTKDKRKIPVEINAHLFEYENKSTILSVIRDITERSHAHLQLSKSREQLRSLALRLQNIREEERAMIAREIHDELGQLLTVLKIQISLISKKLPKNKKSIHERIQSSIQFIDQAVESVQKITTQLRPGILDELGLIPAIEWQAQ